MKTCPKCEKTLPLELFNKSKATADGASSYCKACGKEYHANWKEKNLTPEKAKKYREKFAKDNPGYSTKKKAEWLKSHPERAKVRDAVKYAMKTGKLVRQPCFVCGDQQSETHHPDYSRPLDVVWLCKPHHIQLHNEHI
jgi:hypothetical protein